MRKYAAVSVLFAAALVIPAFAQQQPAGEHVAHHTAALSDGEVRKVNKAAKQITIKHGPLANLDMPAMTMVFEVKDTKMLEKMKPGDKVKFSAEMVGGALTVTRIEAAK